MDDESKQSSKISAPQHPPIGIPPPSSLESMFAPNTGASAANSGSCIASLSPTNLVSNYFSDNYPDGSAGDFRSFSQLLAGATTPSPSVGGAVVGGTVNLFSDCWNDKEGVMCGDNNDRGSIGGASYKNSRPGSLMLPPASSAGGISPLFPISPGFSPSLFFGSPGHGFLTPAQSPLGMSHQQALAQVTAQAAALSQQHHQPPPSQANNFPIHHLHNSNSSDRQQYLFSSSSSALPPLYTNHQSSANNFNGGGAYDGQQQPHLHTPPPPPPPPKVSHPSDHRKPQQQPVYAAPVDKPADDGYNWRKYGQKQVKGSEYPRSYYKCTNPSCPVKKKVERSFDGHITEIIYKGQHNHDPPKNARRSAAKDSGNHQINGLSICLTGGGDHGYSNMDGYHHHQGHPWAANIMAGGDDGSAQATSLQLHGPSDSEESGDHAAHKGLDDDDDDDDDNENQQRNPKRRNTGGGSYEGGAMSHKTVTEPKIIVQTRSEVDLLDDGYRWRKYGQKVVKGNPNPRSYYKCTTAKCNVRKHVERSSTDSKAVITTYEGKHTHDVPASRHSSNIANAVAADTSNHDTTRQQDRLSIPFLQLKEEKIVV